MFLFCTCFQFPLFSSPSRDHFYGFSLFCVSLSALLESTHGNAAISPCLLLPLDYIFYRGAQRVSLFWPVSKNGKVLIPFQVASLQLPSSEWIDRNIHRNRTRALGTYALLATQDYKTKFSWEETREINLFHFVPSLGRTDLWTDCTDWLTVSLATDVEWSKEVDP